MSHKKDGNQLIILSFAKDKVVINNGILLGDEVKITKKPTPFKFNTLYSEQETEYKDFQYTPNFKRPISIIDPETTEEVKPVLYFDEKTNEVKGKCKLKPYKSYFAFEIRDEGQGGNVMTANKKQRDTQIPVEAIEGAAGKDDKGITIVAINPVVLGLLNEKMSNKKKTQVTNSVKRPVDPISTELGISCMSISAENNTRIEKEERQ